MLGESGVRRGLTGGAVAFFIFLSQIFLSLILERA
jgi:hypothetical protein